jgi:DNA-binding transcriptional LysR family regulator
LINRSVLIDNARVDTRRLHLLLELSRLGSMREVAEEHGLTTSGVSQQLAALARETGATLLEREGRRVRLTPAGRRLADHAVTILAAVDAARRDLDASAEPSGTVRVAGFATALRRSLLPAVAELEQVHPRLVVELAEHEPLESFALLAADDVDLALVYDYDLAPFPPRPDVEVQPLWSTPWGLGVPAEEARAAGEGPARLARFRDHTWIVNSRNTADEDAVRTLASLAGFVPRFTHRVDSLDLVEDLIVAGRGVGLLPLDVAARDGVRVLPLAGHGTVLRAYAVTRRGRSGWPPLRAVLEVLVRTEGPGR